MRANRNMRTIHATDHQDVSARYEPRNINLGACVSIRSKLALQTMAEYKNCQAFIKVRKALKEMSQREVAKKTHQSQPAICQIAAGTRKPREAKRAAFKSIGVTKEDWS